MHIASKRLKLWSSNLTHVSRDTPDMDSKFREKGAWPESRDSVTAAVSDERRRSAHLFLVKVPAHHSASSSAALAEGFTANCIQTISPLVQVSTRVRTCLP